MPRKGSDCILCLNTSTEFHNPYLMLNACLLFLIKPVSMFIQCSFSCISQVFLRSEESVEQRLTNDCDHLTLYACRVISVMPNSLSRIGMKSCPVHIP